MDTIKRALLIGVYKDPKEKRQCELSLDELERLCDSYGWKGEEKLPALVKKLDAGTYLSKGKLEEALLFSANCELILFDDEISPAQQRNLEAYFKRPVLDRTELILEIFAKRAETREAKLQIELAKIRYEAPRLKRLWTHLSRQSGGGGGGGGGGYLRGEGEKQIEIDKRLLKKKIEKLEEEIEEVRRHRATQRSQRKRRGVPTFAIVGYTNAGKSSLLKRLTTAEVLIEDKLFATLDTTTRKFILPNKQEILLIDTVGFIHKIPHTLVAAFKSTLEEAVQTDLLLHVIDASSIDAELQAETTLKVLKELGETNPHIITVLNKIDQVSDWGLLQKLKITYPKSCAVSVATGEGIEELVERIEQEVNSLRKKVSLKIPQSHYALVSELLREGRVIRCEYEEDDVLLEAEIPKALEQKIAQFIR